MGKTELTKNSLQISLFEFREQGAVRIEISELKFIGEKHT